jgi:hypothetical protein
MRKLSTPLSSLHVSEEGPDHLFFAASPLLPCSSTGASPAPPPGRRAQVPPSSSRTPLPRALSLSQSASHTWPLAATVPPPRPLPGRAHPELQPQGCPEPIRRPGTKPPPQCPTLPPPTPPSLSSVRDLELDEANGVEEGP